MASSSQRAPQGPTSYREIVKSSGVIGGSSALNILLSIVRTKVFALLIGPSGIGVIGVYQSITTFATALAGLGVNRSGVRQIAESAGTGDEKRIAATITAVRTMSVFLGLVGCLGLILLSVPVSRLTFGDASRWSAICVLGFVVLLTTVYDGQLALIQGLRRIGHLARVRLVGAFLGTVIGIPIVWLFRSQGVAWMLVGVALMNLAASWWFARKVRINYEKRSRVRVMIEVRRLVRLGVSFMGAALVASATVYAIRLVITHKTSLADLGQYTAAYAIAGIYVGFILSAMGSDFYPRLTAKASDPAACNQMVNEQVEVAMLLAVPGILGGLTFAPFLIELFYSEEFAQSARILRWQMLGLLGQVISWPLGFVLLAQARGRLFFCSELLANSVHLGLVLGLVPVFGAEGGGIAFFGVYAVYLLYIYSTVKRLTGFSWAPGVIKMAAWMIPATGVVFLLGHSKTAWLNLGIEALICVTAGVACLRGLLARLGFQSVFEAFARFIPRKG